MTCRMTRISIAMTSYKAVDYIGEQLDSFARQTRLPDELVITEDGNSAEIAAIVDRFAKSVPFEVRYVRNPVSLGMSPNFSHAVSLATGDLVFMSDDDDAWFPHKIETMERAFAADPSAYSFVCDQVIADQDGTLTGRTVLENTRRLGYRDDHYGTGACTAMRRALVDVLLPFADGVPYDHWTNQLPFSMGVRRLIVEPLQMYRRHSSNMTHSLLAKPDATRLELVTRPAGDMRTAYAELVRAIDLQIERLIERRDQLAAGGLAKAAERGLRVLGADRRDHQLRLDALRTPRAGRVPAVARMLLGGNYRRFQGWKSAAKDLVAP